MTPLTYNLSVALGTALIAAGEAMQSVDRALIVAGALIIGLSVFAATLSQFAGRK
ncbi:UNVERIFIED_ORG: hypothetical protein BDU10_8617 [Burkholderia sp. CF145]